MEYDKIVVEQLREQRFLYRKKFQSLDWRGQFNHVTTNWKSFGQWCDENNIDLSNYANYMLRMELNDRWYKASYAAYSYEKFTNIRKELDRKIYMMWLNKQALRDDLILDVVGVINNKFYFSS